MPLKKSNDIKIRLLPIKRKLCNLILKYKIEKFKKK